MNVFNLQKIVSRIKKGNAIILLILSVAFVYILFDPKGLIQRIRLTTEKASLEAKIEELEKENASMQMEIQKLQTSDREIERIAREKYFMHRNGEEIIKIEPK